MSEPTAGRALVVSGPSAVGKSTLVRRLLTSPERRLSVSATTRAPRPGEVEGIHYRFVDRPGFQRLVDQNALLEWAEVYGNRYGTPRDEVDPFVGRGFTVLLDIDAQGFRSVRRSRPGTPGIFIAPPSLAILEKRLRERATEGPDAIRRRLEEAEREMAAMPEYDHVVVNDDLERTARDLEALLERLRAGR